MPVASVVPAEAQRTTVEDKPVAPPTNVLPFTRELLGRGARDGLVDRLAEEPVGSPVYLPGDPRLR